MKQGKAKKRGKSRVNEEGSPGTLNTEKDPNRNRKLEIRLFSSESST